MHASHITADHREVLYAPTRFEGGGVTSCDEQLRAAQGRPEELYLGSRIVNVRHGKTDRINHLLMHIRIIHALHKLGHKQSSTDQPEHHHRCRKSSRGGKLSFRGDRSNPSAGAHVLGKRWRGWQIEQGQCEETSFGCTHLTQCAEALYQGCSAQWGALR
eukprot:scaffold62135_cov21-Tisochrysis_lutea.AAC.1